MRTRSCNLVVVEYTCIGRASVKRYTKGDTAREAQTLEILGSLEDGEEKHGLCFHVKWNSHKSSLAQRKIDLIVVASDILTVPACKPYLVQDCHQHLPYVNVGS